MVATKHIRSSPPAPRVGGWRTAGSGENYAIERLLQQAAALGLRAPELTVVLGERAASLAEADGSDKLWVRAESLVVSARVRLGLRADSVGRAVAALRAAEDLGETVLAAGLRADLAVCARSVGVPLAGLAALRPVLGVAEFSGAGKASALCQLVGCLSQFGRKPELDRTLTEADRLCGSDDELDGDDRLLARALVRVGISAHRRRHADVLGAADAARTGLGLLEQLDDPSCDGGVVRVRLILQLVCSLLDRGDTKNAGEIAESVLTEPIRAASVAPLGWLRMAVATRILLPSGSVEAAAGVLRDAVHSTERHGLHALTSRLWAELAHVEERLGRESVAIECLHQSRAAEHLFARSRRQAMGLLAGEFGNGGQTPLDLDDVLGSSPQSDGKRGSTSSHAASVRTTGDAVAPGTTGHSSGPRNGHAISHRATESGMREAGRSTSEGGHTRLEPDAAERTSIIPRIVEPGDEGRLTTEPARSGTSQPERRSTGESHYARDTWQADATRVAGESGSARESRHASELRQAAESRHVGESRQTGATPVVGERRSVGEGRHVGETREAGDSQHTGKSRFAGETSHAGEARSTGEPRHVDETREADVTREAGESRHASETRQAGETRETPETGQANETRRAEETSVPSAGGRRRAAETAVPEVKLAPVRVERPAVPDLPLAPPPADEPAPRVSLVFEPKPESAAKAEQPTDEQSKPKTRHDAAHGSVAARSVLDRLGISAGSGGGRRRAAADDSGEPTPGTKPAEPDETAESSSPAATSRHGESSPLAESARAAESASSAESSPAESPEPPAPEPVEETKPEAGDAPLAVNDPWLPRLRLPPSLEPFDDFVDEVPTSNSETHFTNTPVIEDGGLGDPFRNEYNGSSPLDDDLPADAGLADLLARALAEHQAGTSSAAALVKRLGNNQDADDDRRTVNGHSRNGEPPASNRHRGGSDH